MATLGRDSYVQNEAGGVPQASANEASGINTSVSQLSTPVPVQGPAGGQFDLQAKYNQDVMDSIFKVGAKLMEPKIREQQAQQAIYGMQQAAAGKSMQDIKKEQPAMARWFGDTAVTEGARTYAANASATDLATGIQNDMEELKKLSPADFQKELDKRRQASMTGDALTDIQISDSYMKQYPSLMSTQMSANFKWQQGELAKAYTQNFNGVAKQSQADWNQVTSENMNEEEYRTKTTSSILGAIQKPEQMTEDTWNSLQGNNMEILIKQGNINALKVIRDHFEVTGNMSPEATVGWQFSIDNASTVAKKKWGDNPDNEAMVANAQTRAALGDLSALDMVNNKYRNDTGDTQNFINSKKLQNDYLLEQYQAKEKARSEANKNVRKGQYDAEVLNNKEWALANPDATMQDVIQRQTNTEAKHGNEFHTDPEEIFKARESTREKIEAERKSAESKGKHDKEVFDQTNQILGAMGIPQISDPNEQVTGNEPEVVAKQRSAAKGSADSLRQAQADYEETGIDRRQDVLNNINDNDPFWGMEKEAVENATGSAWTYHQKNGNVDGQVDVMIHSITTANGVVPKSVVTQINTLGNTDKFSPELFKTLSAPYFALKNSHIPGAQLAINKYYTPDIIQRIESTNAILDNPTGRSNMTDAAKNWSDTFKTPYEQSREPKNREYSIKDINDASRQIPTIFGFSGDGVRGWLRRTAFGEKENSQSSDNLVYKYLDIKEKIKDDSEKRGTYLRDDDLNQLAAAQLKRTVDVDTGYTINIATDQYGNPVSGKLSDKIIAKSGFPLVRDNSEEAMRKTIFRSGTTISDDALKNSEVTINVQKQPNGKPVYYVHIVAPDQYIGKAEYNSIFTEDMYLDEYRKTFKK